MRPTAGVPALMLDGFLTGVIVAPRPIPRHRWLAALWRDEDLNLWDAGRATAERDAIVLRQTALAAEKLSVEQAKWETEDPGYRALPIGTSSFDSGSNGAYDQLTRPPSRGL